MERAQAARDGRREETTAASSTFAATLRKCAAEKEKISTVSQYFPIELQSARRIILHGKNQNSYQS